MHIRAWVIFAVMAISVACGQTAALRPVQEPTPTLSDPHQHVVDANNNALGPQNAAGFSIVLAAPSAGYEYENAAVNPHGTRRAFSSCGQTCQVFVENLEDRQIYELRAPFFAPGRPFSALVWLSDDILVFDQWTQPHYGVHYAVDAAKQKLLLASPFPDELP